MELFSFTPYASGDGFALSATEKDGQPWFIAADVCRSLDIKNHNHAVSRLPEGEKRVVLNDPIRRGNPSVLVVSEAGLYRLIFTSRKASAERFKTWVFAHVLPSIRKHGGYINGMEGLSNEAAQAEVIPAIHALAQRTREQALEERDARYNALKIMRSGPSRKRVARRPAAGR